MKRPIASSYIRTNAFPVTLSVVYNNCISIT